MATVHVFSSRGRFANEHELRRYLEPTYTEDGDEVKSDFMREVDFEEYEPMAIEAIYGATVPVGELLQGASYCDQWLSQLVANNDADSAVCVFSPNVIRVPDSASMRYHGSLEYQP